LEGAITQSKVIFSAFQPLAIAYQILNFRSRFIDYEGDTHTGHQFTYITYGIAVSEIELDILTGQHKLLEAEILMDVGRSLNPAIDIGQIEGAFTQDSFYKSDFMTYNL